MFVSKVVLDVTVALDVPPKPSNVASTQVTALGISSPIFLEDIQGLAIGVTALGNLGKLE